MEATLEEFGILYPKYATSLFEESCEVIEPEPNSESEFRHFIVTGGNGYVFPREFAADTVSFYGKSKSPDPMRLNSDGIFFSEIDDRKCLFICELKSTFSTSQIAHAKEQIMGTVLRLKAQMSILQTQPDWEIHGVIVSFEPTENQIISVNKLTSKDASFSKYLFTKGHKVITAEMSKVHYAPMAMPDITIHYVAVPERKTEYQMTLSELLNL